MVILSLQLLQEIEGAVAVFLLTPVPSVSKENRNHGVDDKQVQRERGEMLLVPDAVFASFFVIPPTSTLPIYTPSFMVWFFCDLANILSVPKNVNAAVATAAAIKTVNY